MAALQTDRWSGVEFACNYLEELRLLAEVVPSLLLLLLLLLEFVSLLLVVGVEFALSVLEQWALVAADVGDDDPAASPGPLLADGPSPS